MSNLSEYMQATSAADASSIEIAGSAIGLVSDFAGAVGAVISFLSFFISILQPADMRVSDAFAKLSKEVEGGTADVEAKIAALAMLDKMHAVDSVFDPARSVFVSLPTIISLLPNDVIVNDSLEKCLTAVLALKDDEANWALPWAAPVAYSDYWSGNVWPPHSAFVFSYIYTLPKFMYAVGMFITVIVALKRTSFADFIPQLNLCIDKLQSVHDTITSSIVGSRVPKLEDVAYVGEGAEGFTAWRSMWFTFIPDSPPVLWPYGAVEPYSGASNMETYWPFLRLKIEPGTIPDSFLKLVALRIENQRKKMYSKIGLPALRQAIASLSALTGRPIPSTPAYESWSLRSAFSILGVPNLSALRVLLRATPPYSGGSLYPDIGDKFPPSPIPRSFRSIFVAN